jgi:YVTN family beta-propeller protein
VYVGLENDDGMTAIDTLTNRVIATNPIGQAPQAVVYVPNAIPPESSTSNAAMTAMPGDVPQGAGTEGLQPLGVAGQTTQLWMGPSGQVNQSANKKAATTVTLYDQGLVQVLEAAVTGLKPGQKYVLGLANEPSGAGSLELLQAFMTNPAGSAIVNAIGPIRQLVRGEGNIPRRYLVIVPGTMAQHGSPVQVQTE